MTGDRVRHIVSLSGGKDSTALAIYLRDRIPNLEYVFCDTEKELPETYEYLDLLEAYLGRPIVRLKHDGRGFDHWLEVYGNYLPSARARWCTRHLKIQPFERYVGDDPVMNYIAIRADEDRAGYISSKPNIKPLYPFKEEGVTREDVLQMLQAAGVQLPAYYSWRSRSGCFFCFFQQKIEWVGLLENHPDDFNRAKAYEKCPSEGTTIRYTWNDDESLAELERPERIAQIRAEHQRRMAREGRRAKNRPLVETLSFDDVFHNTLESYETDRACLICHL